MGEAALTLAIETSNPTAHDGAAAVALLSGSGEDARVLAREPVTAQRRHDDPLMPTIDRIIRDSGHAPTDLSMVAVSVGPGGYTACRIAVTTAKIICRFTGARAIAVPTELAVLDAIVPEPSSVLSVCLAWKHAEVWVRTFDPGTPPMDAPPGRMVPIESMDSPEFGEICCDASLVEKLPNIKPISNRFDPVAVARVGMRLQPIDPLELAVAYPREPEAVRKWRELGR